jgi:hypothetical protein
MIRVPIDGDDIRDFSLLIKSHAPLLFVCEEEAARVFSLLESVAEGLAMPLYEWRAHKGLVKVTGDGPVYKTESPAQALAHLAAANAETIVYFHEFAKILEEREISSRLLELHDLLMEHRGAIVMSGSPSELPEKLANLFTCVRLRAPSDLAYHSYLTQVLTELRKTRAISVRLNSEEVSELIEQLKGLPFFEIRKLLTQAVMEDGKLDAEDLKLASKHKKNVIERSGLLEFIPVELGSSPLAGLSKLKSWLERRRVAFTSPAKAQALGLPAPKGILLVGVQGCGKSLSARATSSIFGLPLLRLAPSTLFRKYFGESEQNMRRALDVAESVAPCILWIDEIEKAFSQGGDQDGGTSRRILGSFLTWLAEKERLVFVVATANDITGLPPELHLAQRRQDPAAFDVGLLAELSEGFSGAEIEQAIVSSLFAAVTDARALDTALIAHELRGTKPLSVTMRERVEALRTWAVGRTVSVDV